MKQYEVNLKVPLTSELLEQYPEYIDWDQIPLGAYHQIPRNLIQEHVSQKRLQNLLDRASKIEDIKLLLEIDQGFLNFESLICYCVFKEKLDTLGFLLDQGIVTPNQFLKSESKDLPTLAYDEGYDKILIYLTKKGAKISQEVLNDISYDEGYVVFYELHKLGVDLSKTDIALYDLERKMGYHRGDKNKKIYENLNALMNGLLSGEIKMCILDANVG